MLGVGGEVNVKCWRRVSDDSKSGFQRLLNSILRVLSKTERLLGARDVIDYERRTEWQRALESVWLVESERLQPVVNVNVDKLVLALGLHHVVALFA